LVKTPRSRGFVGRRVDGIAARPAVQRGVALLIDLHKPLMDDKARENMFAVRNTSGAEAKLTRVRWACRTTTH
jgi:hypothetical protein